MDKISIREAARRGIERVRQEQWAGKFDHLQIDILRDRETGEPIPGPWTHLCCPSNQQINNRDPVDILAVHLDYDKPEWLPYTGPERLSAEYEAEVSQYNAAMAALSSTADTAAASGKGGGE